MVGSAAAAGLVLVMGLGVALAAPQVMPGAAPAQAVGRLGAASGPTPSAECGALDTAMRPLVNADVAQVLTDATRSFAAEVQADIYPGAEHSYH